jgi:hypothetical protein
MRTSIFDFKIFRLYTVDRTVPYPTVVYRRTSARARACGLRGGRGVPGRAPCVAYAWPMPVRSGLRTTAPKRAARSSRAVRRTLPCAVCRVCYTPTVTVDHLVTPPRIDPRTEPAHVSPPRARTGPQSVSCTVPPPLSLIPPSSRRRLASVLSAWLCISGEARSLAAPTNCMICPPSKTPTVLPRSARTAAPSATQQAEPN